MREPLISINDIPQVGTVTVDLMGGGARDAAEREAASLPQRLNASRWPTVAGRRQVRLPMAQLPLRRTIGSRAIGPVRPDARLIMLPTRVEDGVLTYVYEE